MKKEKSLASKIISYIITIILFILAFKLFGIYKTNNFNEFIKAEANMGVSEFKRDKDTKYSKTRSYEIISPEQNNAAFYTKLDVEPDTVYRVSCMIKTKDVIPSEANTDGGASICIIESSENSKSITGTSDWQKVEMLFNSKNRQSVDIGFRLGGNYGTAKGQAWFSDFKVEKGITSNDSTWNVGCFVFKNIDVNIKNEEYKFSLTTSDLDDIKADMQKFKETCKTLTNGKLNITYQIIEIDEPITTISRSDEHGYYIDPYDINELVEDKILEEEFDYVFAAVRMGNEKQQIPVNDWIGLRKYGHLWNRIFKYKNV